MNIDKQIKETTDKILDVLQESKLPASILAYMLRDILAVVKIQQEIALKTPEKEVSEDAV
jgi:hypothetical protein